MKVGIEFGALCPKIRDQLKTQGLGATPERMAMWQHQAGAVVYLAVHGLIPDSVVASARRKILRSIAKHARPSNAALRGRGGCATDR